MTSNKLENFSASVWLIQFKIQQLVNIIMWYDLYLFWLILTFISGPDKG